LCPATGFEDSDLDRMLDNGGSRFGAKFKHDDVGGLVEIGSKEENMRHWYATWNFGADSLIVCNQKLEECYRLCLEEDKTGK